MTPKARQVASDPVPQWVGGPEVAMLPASWQVEWTAVDLEQGWQLSKKLDQGCSSHRTRPLTPKEITVWGKRFRPGNATLCCYLCCFLFCSGQFLLGLKGSARLAIWVQWKVTVLVFMWDRAPMSVFTCSTGRTVLWTRKKKVALPVPGQYQYFLNICILW